MLLTSTAPEQGLPNLYTCAVERISSLPFDLVRRLLSKLLNFKYDDDPTWFSNPHPAGGVDASNQPRMERCCPHVELRGRPTDTLVADINSGRITGITLVRSEPATPIGGAPYLTKSESDFKALDRPQQLAREPVGIAKPSLSTTIATYNTAQVTYCIVNSKRIVTVEIDTNTGAETARQRTV